MQAVAFRLFMAFLLSIAMPGPGKAAAVWDGSVECTGGGAPYRLVLAIFPDGPKTRGLLELSWWRGVTEKPSRYLEVRITPSVPGMILDGEFEVVPSADDGTTAAIHPGVSPTSGNPAHVAMPPVNRNGARVKVSVQGVGWSCDDVILSLNKRRQIEDADVQEWIALANGGTKTPKPEGAAAAFVALVKALEAGPIPAMSPSERRMAGALALRLLDDCPLDLSATERAVLGSFATAEVALAPMQGYMNPNLDAALTEMFEANKEMTVATAGAAALRCQPGLSSRLARNILESIS